MRFQRFGAFLAAAAMVLPAAVQAESQQFDLPGPALRMSVTRGGATLPIAKVPSIAAGDRIKIAAELPGSQGVRYLLVAAFLRGATNPPPKRWFFKAESWERKKGSLDLEVPKGAEQLVLFVVPETGGGFDAVVDTVQRQPGAFVRASIELSQASRDRARLDLFLDGIQDAERNRPAEIPARTEQLTRALSIKVRDECLQQPVEQRAACMGQSENTLLLTDGTRTSLAETLVGAPTDLALQIAATPEGGYGYYSPYIGVVRDVARLFGAFQTTRFTYIPALAQLDGERAGLLLNTAPSFASPKSVMVVGLPPVRPVDPPLLRAGADQVLCAPPGELVLPVTGAPLVYATDYAHAMALRVKGPNGATVDLPARADALRGGYVVAANLLAGQKEPVEAQLHGNWGFAPMDGPSFRLQPPRGGWRIAGEGAGVVVGRDNALTLEGGAAACVSRLSLRDASGAVQEVAWKAAGDGSIAATLPLAKARPGKMTLLVEQQGVAQPESIAIAALAEASRIDRLRFHAGDAEATLYGARLEKVTRLTVGDAVFEPADLGREGKADRLVLRAAAPVAAPAAGQPFQAKAVLADGRSLSIDGTVEAQRPMAAVVSRTVARGGSEGLAIRIEGDTVIPNDARLTFALKGQGSTRFSGTERVEVATEDGRATTLLPVKLQDATIAIASIAPAEALGGSAYGPLRYRVVQGEASGPWAPLGTLVRLPRIAGVACADGQERCTLTGSDLFLLDAVASDRGFAQPVRVPEGFTGTSLAVPKATPLYLQLRDDRTAVASVGK
ncbi:MULTISPECIES: hypothetical protein [Sphingomonas]|uniref:hypothetical protein n=1 Tax=Sphingomonas TaxID=13687 RepID=UPI000F7F7648|nr:hypothetical protein [Sphingomonas sp. ABOLF]RSV10456.1 hypothetical protein CA235_19065 [Sphingomonas sp. ABOLF]